MSDSLEPELMEYGRSVSIFHTEIPKTLPGAHPPEYVTLWERLHAFRDAGFWEEATPLGYGSAIAIKHSVDASIDTLKEVVGGPLDASAGKITRARIELSHALEAWMPGPGMWHIEIFKCVPAPLVDDYDYYFLNKQPVRGKCFYWHNISGGITYVRCEGAGAFFALTPGQYKEYKFPDWIQKVACVVHTVDELLLAMYIHSQSLKSE